MLILLPSICSLRAVYSERGIDVDGPSSRLSLLSEGTNIICCSTSLLFSFKWAKGMCACVILHLFSVFSAIYFSFSVLLTIGVFSLPLWREESLLFIARETVTVKWCGHCPLPEPDTCISCLPSVCLGDQKMLQRLTVPLYLMLASATGLFALKLCLNSLSREQE